MKANTYIYIWLGTNDIIYLYIFDRVLPTSYICARKSFVFLQEPHIDVTTDNQELS